MNRLWAAALAMTCWIAGPAHAADAWADRAKPYLLELTTKSVNGNTPRGLNPDPHFITISPPDWYDAEQAAVSGFSWGTDHTRSAVGGAFRGYSDGSPWAFGIATEAITSPTSHGHVIGAEIDVYSRNAYATDSAKWGINLIFFNRATGNGAAESGIGDNRYNDGAKAMVIEAQSRSPAGEYSGWQTGFYFGKSAFDRTVTKAYASVIDVGDVVVLDAPLYVVVYRCGDQKCGLKLTAQGLELWANIDMLPRFVRAL